YEAGFITYMRTDSTFLSDDAVSMVRAHIESQYGEKYAEPQKIVHKQLEYPLVTDAHHPEFYQVYSIL
ncbi:DNA topoisomerase I subunit omega, partial [Acinetobacter nosocomialis P020]